MVLNKRIQMVELILIVLLGMQNRINYRPVLLQEVALVDEITHKWKTRHESIHPRILQLSYRQ